jgi:hypothetical protein
VRPWVHLSSYIHFPWFYYSTMISKSWEDHFPRNNRCFIIYVIPLSYHCTISIDFWCSSCKYIMPYIYIASPYKIVLKLSDIVIYLFDTYCNAPGWQRAVFIWNFNFKYISFGDLSYSYTAVQD